MVGIKNSVISYHHSHFVLFLHSPGLYFSSADALQVLQLGKLSNRKSGETFDLVQIGWRREGIGMDELLGLSASLLVGAENIFTDFSIINFLPHFIQVKYVF